MFPSTTRTKHGRELVIREATGADAASILEYVQTVAAESDFLTFGAGEFEMTLDQETAFLKRTFRTDNAVFLVAETDGAIVGTLAFAGGGRPRNKHAGEFGMSVRKQVWGVGIGGALVDALIWWAEHAGLVSKINLRVRTDNARAIALYESRGFVREGTMKREIRIAGRYYDHDLMGREL